MCDKIPVGVQVFDFDIAAAREEYGREGWVHIKNGIHPEFLAELQKDVPQYLDTNKLDAFAIKARRSKPSTRSRTAPITPASCSTRSPRCAG